LEEQILRFYLKVFSYLLIPILYFIYIFFIKEIVLKNEYLIVKKFDSFENIIDQNIKDYPHNIFFYKNILRLILINKKTIHYGKFELNNRQNFFELVRTILSPSNYLDRISIIEGWSKNDLNEILSKKFTKFDEIEYSEIIADTYMFNEGSSFRIFKYKLENSFLKLKEKYQNHSLLNKFSFKEIMIIGSLLEKEGIDYNDKKKIFSVIINRLNKKMKLQIDATVIYSITRNNLKLDRNLNYDDLKIKDPFNTYVNFGLPPEPISYVGYKTIELIFENYKTDYLFYFYNADKKEHIFTKNYKNHLKKLNEYRSK